MDAHMAAPPPFSILCQGYWANIVVLPKFFSEYTITFTPSQPKGEKSRRRKGEFAWNFKGKYILCNSTLYPTISCGQGAEFMLQSKSDLLRLRKERAWGDEKI
jgi:hypothetical protein